MDQARFLVLEDEPPTAKALARLVSSHGTAVIAPTVRDALGLLARFPHWSGLILDVVLPDGSGLDVLARARTSHPATPALMLTGHPEHRTFSTAYDLGATCLLKPITSHTIERFLRSTSDAGFADRVKRVVEAWAERYKLSAAEADVLRRAALGQDRKTIASGRNASELTIKRQVANLLRLTQDASLHEATDRILRELARTV